ncbi:TldD/PmbA family protein [Candidatus Bathyarchaeota archaeon]|nr:TldD/PmbA family protein [Candidatus Bathyarchaeota archaeon]
MDNYINLAKKVIEKYPLSKGNFLEIRFFIGEFTNINIRNNASEQISNESKIGVALRALIDGAWGFSTSKNFTKRDLSTAMETAISASKASVNGLKEKSEVPLNYTYTGKAPLKIKIDPRSIPLEEKIKVAIELEKNIRIQGDKIKVSTASLTDIVQREIIVNSLGTEVDVSNCYVRMSGSGTAREGTLIQNASNSVGTSRGWETITEINPTEMGSGIGKRAMSLLTAQAPPGGSMNVLMDPTLVGVFIHEAFGHAIEADSIINNMSVLAGKVGHKVGVEGINVYEDPTIPGLRGSYEYDSEGTKTRKRVIVDKGVLKGYLHSLETAAKMGAEPNGGGRAENFNYKPIPRMGVTYIDKGDMSLEELCQEIKEGVYLSKSYGGYVNPAIGQFFFTAQEGRIITKGEMGPLIQNVSMSGLTLEVLSNVLGIGKDLEMAFPGTCGKGQSAPVTGGGPSLAVKNVVVGGSR